MSNDISPPQIVDAIVNPMKVSVLPMIVPLVVGMAAANLPARADAYAVYKSVDGGDSWVRSDAGLPGASRINAFGSTGRVLFAGTDSGVFSSRDDARSWQPANGTAASSLRILSFAAMGGKVFCGTDGEGILVSGDSGESWSFTAAIPAPKVRCLIAHDGSLFAGTDAGGVFASSDGGHTWDSLREGFPVGAQVFSMTELRGALFAGLYGRGLFRWDQQTRSWSEVGQVEPLALATLGSTLIAGHNPGGLFWSGDSGATWSKGIASVDTLGGLFPSEFGEDSGQVLAEAPVWEMASNDRLAFAGASAGIYYSNDQGRHWTQARAGLPEGSPGVAFLAREEFVLAATMVKRSHADPNELLSDSQPLNSGTRATP